MARPKNADPARTLSVILESARALLEEGGAEMVTLRQVAKRAGVGLGTIRYYFERHEDLVEACLEPYQRDLLTLERAIVSALQAADDPRRVIEQAVRLGYDLVRQDRAYARTRTAATSAHGALSPSLRAENSAFLERVAKHLGALSVEPTRSRLAAYSLLGLIPRYASMEEQELAVVVGCDDVTLAHDRAKAHLVELAVLALFPPP